jgi:hypothetical protein
MNKENNCRCAVCHVEHDLLDSLSTQTARTHFQALAHNHPILNHFGSPADALAQLRKHEDFEVVNQFAWNAILHALVEAIASGTAEEIGQQLLLLAFMPAIHRTYSDVCQRFPALPAEDMAQQASLVFMEAARSPFVTNQNGYLPVALAREFRRRLFRWAFTEVRQSPPSEDVSEIHPEPASDKNFEDAVLLENFLSQWQRAGVLSQEQCDLLRKFKCEGCYRSELGTEEEGASAIALYFRVYRTINRLRRVVQEERLARTPQTTAEDTQPKNISREALTFPESVAISNSEKGFSPELSHDVPQIESDIPHIAA